MTSKKYNSVNSTMEWDYDAAGRVTKLTHPDGFDVDYEYDLLSRPIAVKDGSTTLASVAYDDRGRRASLNYANGTSQNYNYDGGSRLSGLDIDLSGTANDQSYGFTYNPASQAVERTRTNSAYDWMLPGAATDDYISNGLNQYEVVDGVTVAYDDNGNMTTDHRGQQYTYAANNMLRQVHDSSSTLLANPIAERVKARYKPKRLTIKEAIEGCHAAKQAELKGKVNSNRWLSPLSTHIIPTLGTEAIEDLHE